MSDKEKPSPKPAQKLTEEETAAIVGGMGIKPGGGAGGLPGGLSNAPPSCVASEDTGMMGCPG